MDVLEFSGIEPNPAYETLMNAVKLVREQKVTFLLAVGGGSVLTTLNLSPQRLIIRKISIRGTFCKRAVKKLKAPSRWAVC